MQMENNFSSSVSFNIFYLEEPNKSVTHTHTHTHSNRLSSCTKAIAVHSALADGQPFQASARSFQSFLQMLFCVLKSNSRMIFIILN